MEAGGAWRCILYFLGIYPGKQIESVLCFVISPPLRLPGRVMESLENPNLLDLLNILLTRQRISKKSLPVICRKYFLIGQEPGLHHLNHQVSLLVEDTRWALPVVAPARVEMPPHGSSDGRLRFYE